MRKLHFTALPIETRDIHEVVKFQCESKECEGKSFLSTELLEHSQEVHNCGWIQMDTSSLYDMYPQLSIYGEATI